MTQKQAIEILEGLAVPIHAEAAFDMAIEALKQPERKKGKWIKDWWNGERVRRCSACNISQTVTVYKGKIQFRFCPYCGADMRGKDDDESRGD